MGFSCGIVGLPNVGKSTIFNALTSAKAAAANFPFCTIEPNTGAVAVPDPRLDTLAKLAKSERTIPTLTTFVDIAGLIKGASKGEGLGNQFLGHIRNVDAIAHVVRAFVDENVVHVESSGVNPKRDVDTIEVELILSDLEYVSKKLQQAEKSAKSGEKGAKELVSRLLSLQTHLSNGKLAIFFPGISDEQLSEITKDLITAKPTMFVLNVAEGDAAKDPSQIPLLKELLPLIKERNAAAVIISGKVESEIAELNKEDRQMYLDELGLKSSGLDRMAVSAYSLLNLATFFTAGKKEARAWTVVKGSKAPQAAGKIHSDFERGFIAADVISYEDYLAAGSEAACRDRGTLRTEGKEYVVQDGDVVHFKFNV